MKWKTFSQLTLIEQSFFGLPWVLAAALLPLVTGWSASTPSLSRWIAGIAAFVAARTAGMCFNRLIDRDIDAANPRTAERSLPKGEVSVFQVKLLAWLNAAAFIVLCAMISPMILGLSPFALFLIWAYSYTKRFTLMCHLILGCVHGFATLMAWAMVTSKVSWPAVLLSLAVMTSIAGMDIVYALQDTDFDRREGLHSIPASLGLKKSLNVARLLHVITVTSLLNVAYLTGASWLFYVGIGVVAVIYLYHHRRLGEVNIAFFRCNTQVGAALLMTTIVEGIWKVSSLG